MAPLQNILWQITKKHLVIVGDSLDSSYQNNLNSLVSGKEDRVIFAGGIYDQTKLNMIRQHCFAHIHGHSAGGTNPSLLEAMIMGKAILAHRNPFNSNVLGSNELSFYDSESLSNAVNMLEADQILRSRIEKRNRIRAKKKFTWERCFSKHERAFKALFDREFRSKMLKYFDSFYIIYRVLEGCSSIETKPSFSFGLVEYEIDVVFSI